MGKPLVQGEGDYRNEWESKVRPQAGQLSRGWADWNAARKPFGGTV